MKKNYFFTLPLITIISYCGCQGSKNYTEADSSATNRTEIETTPDKINQLSIESDSDISSLLFENPNMEYDIVVAGDTIIAQFVFTNTSDKEVLINEVVTGCKCTEAVWPTDPILPNAMDSILVYYDTYNRPSGRSRNRIKVSYNQNEESTTLQIEATILNLLRPKNDFLKSIKDNTRGDTINAKGLNEIKVYYNGYLQESRLVQDFATKEKRLTLYPFEEMFSIDTLGRDKFCVKVNMKNYFALQREIRESIHIR